jgi:prepilin-type processing-associated H-X9-DG protein
MLSVCGAVIVATGASTTSSTARPEPLWDGASSLTGTKPVRTQVILLTTTNDPNEGDLPDKIGPLDISDLQRQVDRGLLKAGIKLDDAVMPSLAPGGSVWLTVAILVNKTANNKGPVYAAFVNTEVLQKVQLPGAHAPVPVTTWPGIMSTFFGRLLVLDSSTMKERVSAEVIRQVNLFINDYIAVNTPSEQTADETAKCPKCATVLEAVAVDGKWDFRCPKCRYSKTADLESRLVCADNLNAISQGLYKYVMDHDNHTFAGGERWCDLLVQGRYVNEKQLICPNTQAKKGRSSYTLNKNVLGKGVGTIAPDTVLFFEAKPGWNRVGGPELLTSQNHEGNGANVAFIDTHAEFVEAERVGQLKWSNDQEAK